MIDFRLFHPRMICPAGQGPHLPETTEKRQKTKSYPRRATKNDEGPLRRDGSAASAGLRLGNPARPPSGARVMGGGPPGSAGAPPASSPFACRSVSLRCPNRPPCRREPHGPGRSRALAPLPVDPGEGDGRGCGKTCAGGTPALPGGLYSTTSSNQRRSIRLQCLFVFIRGSSSFKNPVHPVHPCSMSRKPV